MAHTQLQQCMQYLVDVMGLELEQIVIGLHIILRKINLRQFLNILKMLDIILVQIL